MQENNVIEVNNVYKKFKNYFDKSHSLKERILSRARNEYEEYWVLKGIDFSVKRGEAVGLIGCNGCGKSTTLKLLTKIIYPDKGKIEVRGRVSSLLELGAGFHPDLSGYENIYLNAAVFGLTKKEIDRRVDEIIRFSELREFINNPIRTYSSGMYMKLAFSVAINVDADILLIDEILGVGDMNFQKKCFEKLVSIKKKGTTIVIVSHSMDQIEKICDRSIWIDKGKVVAEGEPKRIHALYMDKMNEKQIVQRKKEEEERLAEERRRAEEKKREEEKRRAEEKRREEERRRKEDRKKARDIQYKRQIEEMQKEVSVHREQERREIELRRENRKKLYNDRCSSMEKYGADYSENLKKQETEEIVKQESLLKKAAEVREKQAEVQNAPKQTLATKMEMRVEFYKKEAERLELVVQEKEAEIERLNSVIRQRNIEIEKNHSEYQKEISRLETAIYDKDEELERLNSVILEKDIELDRVNMVIMQKDYEISKITEM